MKPPKHLDAFFTHEMFFNQSKASLEHYTRRAKNTIFVENGSDELSCVEALALASGDVGGNLTTEKRPTAAEGSRTNWKGDGDLVQQASGAEVAEDTSDLISEASSSSTDYDENLIDQPNGCHPPAYISEPSLSGQKIQTDQELSEFATVRCLNHSCSGLVF